jgi:hypothetical protein
MRENAMQEGHFDPNETRFIVPEGISEPSHPVSSAIAMVQTPHAFHQFRLHDQVKIADLKTIREILIRHPGENPVTLNLLLEGHRQNIDTGIRAKIDDPDLKKELSPFILGMPLYL